MHLKNSTGVIASTLAALSATAAIAATTPYDLIRPTWPLSWDAKVFENFDTTVTKKIGVLNIPATPASFKAGAMMPDTLDQAYLDAINTKISPIRVNQAGYLKSDTERQFYFVGTKASEFEVVDADGKSLSTKITGTFTATETATKSDWTIIAGTNAATNDQQRYKVEITGPEGNIFVGKIPQNVPTEKRLRIKVGDEISSTFIVSDDVYTMVKDASLKFFGIQRSGNSESWFHGPSHTKDGGGKVVVIESYKSVAAEGYTSKEGALQGGWYDAGDHLKESQTQAFAFAALAVMHATNPAKDVDHYAYNQGEFVKTDDVPDVLREAKHGADFFLKAYEFAKGVVDDMPVSVGNFGSDHGWWGRPEVQDYVTVTGRGGSAERDVRLGELGSNISGEIAAGLAILSKDYAKYDKKFADSCLVVAEKMYDFAKALAQGKDKYDGDKPFVNNKRAAGWGSPAYQGNNEFTDDLALASVALLYATGKKDYADDMIRVKDLFPKQSIRDTICAGCFAGGWFAADASGMLKNGKNTSWANAHSFALYALYKLILADKTKATSEYGLTEEERLAAIEDCLADMIANLGDVSGTGTGSIVLPKGDIGWKQNTVSYDPIWYTMLTDQAWIFNGYQAGNIFEVLAYADVAADIEKQGVTLPAMASTGLKASEMRQLGINQLNYLFGINPWDISFVYGVGDKNDAHPFHRAANPEGKNMPGLAYKYNAPVGALVGWQDPATTSMNPDRLSWENFYISEVTLNAATLLTSALTLVSNGGSDYYEKKCDNCDTTEASPFSNEVYAAAYHYTWTDMDMFNIQIFNETMKDVDSVVAYVYFDATEEDIDACGAIFDEDLCQAYDIAGFNKPCDNDSEIRNYMRSNRPVKVEDTYNKDKKTYTWAQAISVGTIGFGRKLRFDISISSGTKVDGKCETLRTPAKVKVTDSWSFTAHSESKDAPAYDGAPDWDKDQGDIQQAPQDPYIVIRSKGKLLWGYGPGNTTSDRVGFVKPVEIAKARMQVAKNKLYVLASAQGSKTVKIFDMLGNQLMAQDFYGTRTEVNLAKLPHRGALIARVVQNGKTLATQSIKVK
ncbi:Glycosyl hydrolase family 9 [Fibrobacter sp. UWB15]|uniref:glycoside hydrolase family 9 protein n=1 Tax=unclassified Fibrobacter TaxID=2634177 RepID=UPI0009130EFB|nr:MULTISPECIES: glycoside hydrolase family 9 protein [unclassified Fibrobacter]PWJ63865.1 glycosyl hydrolase family 9 [Fibrobacter sp. UWB6]SHG25415.1 Glycosyl hydrolase family 9 [Fibrobacter sp. UWB8]SMG35037.1 Glycosyl hydrolase family 9 [Fibrobacter sp. UWB15]